MCFSTHALCQADKGFFVCLWFGWVVVVLVIGGGFFACWFGFFPPLILAWKLAVFINLFIN